MVNIFLFEKEDVNENGTVFITNQAKLKHIYKVLKSKEGDTLRAGIIGEGKGVATIIKMEKLKIELKLEITNREIPKNSNIFLVIAIPRPQMITKILSTASTMGVDRIFFISSSRAEKNYFKSEKTSEKEVRRELVKGAEQGVTVKLPIVSFHKRPFSKFITSNLSEIYNQIDEKNIIKCVAELGEPKNILEQVFQVKEKRKNEFSLEKQQFVCAIGPEGGWVEEEVKELRENEWLPFCLGDPNMRVETAMIAVCSQLLLVKSSHFLLNNSNN